MIQGIVKINVSAEDVNQAKKIGGGLQDLADLIKKGEASADDAIKLLQKVKQKPSLVKKALKFI